jgi:hypothetical protein
MAGTGAAGIADCFTAAEITPHFHIKKYPFTLLVDPKRLPFGINPLNHELGDFQGL